jgi:hypothetical protein
MSDDEDDCEFCDDCGDDDCGLNFLTTTIVGLLCQFCMTERIGQLIDERDALRAALAAAREREAKLRAAWPGRKDYTNEAGVLAPFKQGWVLSGIKGWWPDVDAAINAAAGIEEPRT